MASAGIQFPEIHLAIMISETAAASQELEKPFRVGGWKYGWIWQLEFRPVEVPQSIPINGLCYRQWRPIIANGYLKWDLAEVRVHE